MTPLEIQTGPREFGWNAICSYLAPVPFFYFCLKQSPCQNLRPCGHCPSVTCFMVRNVDLEEKTHESINFYVSQIRSNLSLALCKAKVSVTCVQLLLSIALFS